MWEQVLVGLIVVAAVLALLRRWLPRRWLQRWGLASDAAAQGGCSSCAGCSGSSGCAAGTKPGPGGRR